jgi:hypothetical protein
MPYFIVNSNYGDKYALFLYFIQNNVQYIANIAIILRQWHKSRVDPAGFLAPETRWEPA